MANISLEYSIQRDILTNILQLLLHNESVTTLWMPKAGRSYNTSNLCNKVSLNEYLQADQIDKLAFVYVDQGLNKDYFDRQLEEGLAKHSKQPGITEKIREITQTKQLIFVVSHFNFINVDVLQFLLSLSLTNQSKTCFLFLSYCSDFFEYQDTADGYSQIFHNLVYVPYLSKEDSLLGLDIWSKHYNKSISQDEKEQIYSFAGGNVFLLRNLVRSYTPDIALENIFALEHIKAVLNNLWERFSVEERGIIHILKARNSKQEPLNITQGQNQALDYFKKCNFIDNTGNIIGEWVNYHNTSLNEIKLDDVSLSTVLTTKESKLLELLTENRGKVVDREMISNKLMGDEKDEYSNWAIDQQISRLRKTLAKHGMPEGIIKTKKGQGYFIE